jgi:predicted nucleotide-binding protein
VSSRRRPPEPPPLELKRFSPVEAEHAINRLEARIADVKALDPQTIRHDDESIRAAERMIRSTILEVFGERSPEYADHQYHEIEHGRPTISFGGFGERDYEADYLAQRYFATGIPRTITMLESLIRTVKERTDAARPVLGTLTKERPPAGSGKVFVVHGRAEGPRDAVARFVGQLGLTPVILQEQASEGNTIIEKFEKHADVGYAVVLLTGDDRGGLATADPSTYAPRARQNVILELGYFVGKLGRSRVCVLHEQGVEIPSDFHGVVYVPLDAGGAWKLTLAKEMKVAGLSVDLNRAL